MVSRFVCVLMIASIAYVNSAWAEPVTMASAGQGSSTYNFAVAISKAVSEYAGDVDLRPQPYDSTSQASTFVNGGQVDFGLENAIAIRQAMLGEGRFKDHILSDLRLVARLVPLRMTLAVRADSGIKSLSDLRGKRLPAGFPQAVTGEALITAMLSTGGLGYSDVQSVQVANFTAMAEAFVDGDLDAFIHVIGTPRDEQVSRDVNGIRPLQLGSTDSARSGVKMVLPVADLYFLQPQPGLTTISEATEILQYDYFVYTNAGESESNVMALLNSLYDGKATMVQSVASLNWFQPEDMYLDIGLPYHPAAEKFYREHGMLQ